MDVIDVSSPVSPTKGKKRGCPGSGGGLEAVGKRIKTGDLDSFLLSEDNVMHHSEFSSGDTTTTDISISARGLISGSSEVHPEVTKDGDQSLSRDAALSNFCNFESDSEHISIQNNHSSRITNRVSAEPCHASKSSSLKRLDKDLDCNVTSSSGVGLHLNAEHVPNMFVSNPFYPYKNLDNIKSKGASECGSCTGPLEENESLKTWKAMKKNGFLSYSYGGIPVPKSEGIPISKSQSSKKSKADAFKKKFELAKREQVNRFTRIAAPSGLLSGLNPGIINHVRNSKQVHAIIEALVKSEKHNLHNLKRFADPSNRDNNEVNSKSHDQEALHAQGDTFSFNKVSPPTSEVGVDISGTGMFKGDFSKGRQFNSDSGDERLKVTSASENASCISSAELASQDGIMTLSVKAANVASQWLALLHEDIRGRIAALRTSRRRVRSVIQRELPSLLSRQYVSSQEEAGSGKLSNVLDMHMERWRLLFNQMEKELSEEGKHLEISLEQIKEMQEHCKQGLQFVKIPGGLRELGSSNESRFNKAEAMVKECAVRAAAASIYSTCNLVMTSENVTCI